METLSLAQLLAQLLAQISRYKALTEAHAKERIAAAKSGVSLEE